MKLFESMPTKYFRPLLDLEKYFATTALVLISLLPFIEIISRTTNTTVVSGSIGIVRHLVLWLTFAAGIITTRSKEHLTITAGIDMIKEPFKRYVQMATSFLLVIINSAFTYGSYTYINLVFESTQKVGIFPITYFVWAFPLGFALMTIYSILKASTLLQHRLLLCLGIVVCYFIPSIPFEIQESLLTPAIILLALAGIMGLPIYATLGGIAALLFFVSSGEISTITDEAYKVLNAPYLPAIPLFTFAGFILSESKSGERLMNFFNALFGFLPGGTTVAAVIVCAFFTTFTGASGITILALGGVLSFILVKNRYSEKFSHGLLTASGSIGLLFPPSLPIILYGVSAQIDIRQMFIAGILPGTLMIVALIILGVIHARKNGITTTRFSVQKLLQSINEAKYEVALPLVILILFFTGTATLVETGSVAVLYAIITQCIIHKDISLRSIYSVMLKCMPIIGGVLIIIALSQSLSFYIVMEDIPTLLSEWIEARIESKYTFLILLNILLLIVGCFMDIFSAIIVVAPLIIPLGNLYGIHPVHLGVIFLANLELGYLTPPVGLNLFLSSFRFKKPLTQIYRDVVPFLLILVITVLLITYLPFLSTMFIDSVK